MSIRKRRAGRKSWETRLAFVADVGNFAAAMADAEWKYTAAETDAIRVVRKAKATGAEETISFSRAYAEISPWLGRSFSNNSDFGLSDMLAESLLRNAVIHTGKAEYRQVRFSNNC
jgi:hypothetical protein